ncbi:RHS repeat domain-containing protein [Deferrisoma camini]|uniref:RHS repeat domain-containing protein n=1 Tax=Deferrisoma camini TaxID=1035120 RepID=UPI001FDEE555|nr:RHS repeat-associated core domain-containing protein [Deferrisoma camini]
MGQLVDAGTGAVVAHYEYDPFGRQAYASGAVENAFRFSSKYADDELESPIYYYGYRYYSPELGRWMTRDPIHEHAFSLLQVHSLSNYGEYLVFRMNGLGYYVFVSNNALVNYDILGLDCCSSGNWSGVGVTVGGALFFGGAFSGMYNVACWGQKNSCLLLLSCYGVGYGLGGGFSIDSIWISGVYDTKGFSGRSSTGIIFGGVGIAGVGGTYPLHSRHGIQHAKNASVSYGVGFGLGGGWLQLTCSKNIVSCN